MKLHRPLLLCISAAFLLLLCPPAPAATVTGRAEDTSLAGTEKLPADSSGTDTYILVSRLWTSMVLSGGVTASGSTSFDFSGSTGDFLTSTGVNTFGGSSNLFTNTIRPSANDGAALGTGTVSWSDLFLAAGGVINWSNGALTLTEASGVLTVAGSGTGDLRITTAGTNAASVVTNSGTQTLTNKTLTSPVIATGLTASGSAANNFSGSTGTFLTSTGLNTFGGSGHAFAAKLYPSSDDGAALGDSTHHFSDLFLATGAVLNFQNGNVAITHSSGILTMGTGELRITTAGTNTASVPTLGSTSTLTNKTLTTPTLTTPVISAGLSASGSAANDFSASTGTFLTSSGANTLSGAVTIADATTPSLTTAAGKTNTGFLQVNGKTSGALKLIAADAAGQTLTVSLAAQTTGAATLSIPDLANVSHAFMVSSLTTNTTDAANSVTGASNALVFEGATADASEIKITPADATADVIYLLADAAAGSYSLMGSTLATNAPDIANSVTGTSGGLFFEGATANSSEIKLVAADATADAIYTLPDAAAATYSLMSSTLATNAPDIANSVTGASAALVFEGSTADGFEATITATDPTADTTATLPKATGTFHLSQASTAVSLTADDQAVTPGAATVIQLSSDNATATNRTFTLSATGAITGQIYILIGPASNQCEIADTGIQKLSATWSPSATDTLTLIFDGTNFIELARADN